MLQNLYRLALLTRSIRTKLQKKLTFNSFFTSKTSFKLRIRLIPKFSAKRKRRCSPLLTFTVMMILAMSNISCFNLLWNLPHRLSIMLQSDWPSIWNKQFPTNETIMSKASKKLILFLAVHTYWWIDMRDMQDTTNFRNNWVIDYKIHIIPIEG